MTLLSVLALAAALTAPLQMPNSDSAVAAPPAVGAQSAGADSAAVVSAPVPGLTGSGLPQRAPVARTMSAYWPVFAGFTVVWLGILAYALSFGRRSARLAEELHRLEAERAS